MGVIRVIDKQTGQELSVDERSVQAEPDAYEIVPGQVASVKPAAGGVVEGGILGQDISADTLRPEQAFERATSQEVLETTREQAKNDRHDTVTNTLSQAAQGVASSATFGLSDLATRGLTEFDREDQREAREVGDGAYQTARFVTDIATAFLPTAPLKALKFARIAPSAQLSYLTGRIAAGGTGKLAKIGRTALGEAIEGAAHNVGATLARESLNENPALSAEALLVAAGQGGALGGAFGGAAAGIGAGARRLRSLGRAGEAAAPVARAGSAVAPTTERKALDAMFGGVAPAARRRAGRPAETLRSIAAAPADAIAALGGAAPAARRSVGFDTLMSRRAKNNTSKQLGQLISHVDESATASVGALRREIPDVGRRLDRAGVDRSLRDELVGDMTRLSDDFGRASAAASGWMRKVTRELGTADLKKMTPAQVLKRLPDELEEQGAEVLADLDGARSAYTAARNRVDTSLADVLGETQAASAASGVAAPSGVAGITGRLRERLKSSRLAETATTVAGAAELARDAGVDVPLPSVGDIPGVGRAMSLYVRFKAGANAAKRFGVLPATPTTAAAGRVNTTRDRIQDSVSRASRGVLKAAGTKTAERFLARTAGAVVRQLTTLRATTPNQVAAEAAGAVAVDPALAQAASDTARRAHEYLLAQAPQNPLAGTGLADDWVPSPVQRQEWAITSSAVADPVAALERSFTAPFPDLAIDAVRHVYPALYTQLQSDIFAERDKLRATLPEHRLEALGRVYDVPLTISQLPAYRALPPPAAAQGGDQPELRTASPKGSTTSPVSTLEFTADQARQR